MMSNQMTAKFVTGLAATFSCPVMLAMLTVTPAAYAQVQAQQEQFVPRNSSDMATLEIRPSAIVYGNQITLKQVARWSRNDLAYFDALQDLVVANVTCRQGTVIITHEQIRTTLHDAGVNLSTLRMTGAATVTVNLSSAGVRPVEQTPAENLAPVSEPSFAPDLNISSNRGMTDASEVDVVAAAVKAQIAQMNVGQVLNQVQGTNPDQSDDDQTDDLVGPKLPIELQSPDSQEVGPSQVESRRTTRPDSVEAQQVVDLRTMLSNELANRSRIPLEQLQIDFAERDRGILSLARPQFTFDIQPRSSILGPVSWQVTISAGGEARRVQIDAMARAWFEQAVVVKPIAMQQIISQADIETRRVLVDSMPTDMFVSSSNVIGQQASRDLRPGTVITGRMVKAPELVRTGQLVTVTLNSGQVQVKAVAKALSSGSKGQTIKVQNQSTKQVFEVVVVGPQEAAIGDTAVTSVGE